MKAPIPTPASPSSRHSSIRWSAGSGPASSFSSSARFVALVPSLNPATAVVARPRHAHRPQRACAQRRRLMAHSRTFHFLDQSRRKPLVLAVAVCFSIGATDSGSRFNDLNHRLMCTCGCAQTAGRVQPRRLPRSGQELTELSADIAAGMSDKQIFSGSPPSTAQPCWPRPPHRASTWSPGSLPSRSSARRCSAPFCSSGAGPVWPAQKHQAAATEPPRRPRRPRAHAKEFAGKPVSRRRLLSQ